MKPLALTASAIALFAAQAWAGPGQLSDTQLDAIVGAGGGGGSGGHSSLVNVNGNNIASGNNVNGNHIVSGNDIARGSNIANNNKVGNVKVGDVSASNIANANKVMTNVSRNGNATVRNSGDTAANVLSRNRSNSASVSTGGSLINVKASVKVN